MSDQTPTIYEAKHTSGRVGTACKVNGRKWAIKVVSVEPPSKEGERPRSRVSCEWWDADWELGDEVAYTPSLCRLLQQQLEYLSKFIGGSSHD